MNSRSILVVIPSLRIGGAEIQTIHQIAWLVKKGYKPFLVILSTQVDENLLEQTQLPEEQTLILENSSGTLTFRSLIRLKGLKKVLRLVKTNQLEKAIGHLPLSHFFLRLLNYRGAGLKLVHYHHGMEFEANPINSIGKKVFHKINVFLGKKYDDQHWFISEANAADYSAHFPVKESYVIPNSLDPNLGTDSKTAEEILNRLPIPSNSIIALFPGRIHPAKGHLRFLKVWKSVLEQFPNKNVHLVIAGYGKLESEIKEFIKDHHLGPRVHLIGKVNHQVLLALYEIVQFTVVPSFSEGFGLVAIEALFKRSLLLTSNAGGLDEIITDGENGFKFDTDNNDELKQRLNYIIENYPCPEIDKEAAAQNALKKYGMETQIEKIIALLN